MPVSRKRKKTSTKPNKRPSRRTTVLQAVPRQEITGFHDLKDLASEALLHIPADDLDSMGLASYYMLVAPSDQLNQCLPACATIWLARKRLGAASEVVPVVLEIPWAHQRWGTPQPVMRPDDTTDGHVVLLTDKGQLIDITAAQFPALNKQRGGLPIMGRNRALWDTFCAPDVIEQDLAKSVAVDVLIDPDTGRTVRYELHHPYRAAKLIEAFLAGGPTLAKYVEDIVNSFVWIIANTVLVGDREQEIQTITNITFAERLRAAKGQPQPTLLLES